MGITGYVGVLLIGLAIVLAVYALRRLRLLREGGIHVAGAGDEIGRAHV